MIHVRVGIGQARFATQSSAGRNVLLAVSLRAQEDESRDGRVVLVIHHLVLRDSTHLRDQNSQQPEGSSSGKASEGSEAVPLPSRELTAVSDSSGSLTGPGGSFWDVLSMSRP